jgi:YfiH family protein
MWTLEPSALGRILVPPFLPAGFALFSTTRDYRGRIVAHELTDLIRDRFGPETSLTTCLQIHSATAVRARSEREWRECDSCDALWSDELRVALAVKVADCLPVSLIDPRRHVIANIHSGWRGAVQRITPSTLDAVMHATTFDPAASLAYLGPSIRACCFEVGEEVASQFDERYIDRSRTKPHVDLVAQTMDILRSRGFADERIYDSEICTRCEGSVFHSYRRDPGSGGRNLVVVAQ